MNHALLTAEAIEHRNLPWAGWVANIFEPNMPALAENLAELEMRLPSPCLGRNLSPQWTLPHTNLAGENAMHWINLPE